MGIHGDYGFVLFGPVVQNIAARFFCVSADLPPVSHQPEGVVFRLVGEVGKVDAPPDAVCLFDDTDRIVLDLLLLAENIEAAESADSAERLPRIE